MIFYIPPIASSILLLLCWRDLGTRALLISGGTWLAATWLQFYGRSLGAWVTGLLLHVGLAIYLSIRRKLDG